MTPFEERMSQLRARFLVRAAEDAGSIERALAAGDFASMRDTCHRLAGNAGMFGFADAGIAAQTVEQALDADEGEERLRSLTADLLVQLRALDQEPRQQPTSHP